MCFRFCTTTSSQIRVKELSPANRRAQLFSEIIHQQPWSSTYVCDSGKFGCIGKRKICRWPCTRYLSTEIRELGQTFHGDASSKFEYCHNVELLGSGDSEMKKLLYTASVMLLGAGLAVAQSSSSTDQSSSTTSTTTQTPSASTPQTNAPDSMDKQNPSSGQNPDSQKNPSAAGSMSGNTDSSSASTSTDTSGMSGDPSSSAKKKHHHKKSSTTTTETNSTTTTTTPSSSTTPSSTDSGTTPQK